MIRWFVCLGLFGLVGLGSVEAQAQGYDPISRPTVSPYLNLLNNVGGFNSNGVDTSYQTLVRPLLDQSAAISNNAANLNRVQRQLNYGKSPAGRGSPGTSGRFMNYSHYYSMPR